MITVALRIAALIAGAMAVPSCRPQPDTHPQVVVLGFDGMDPRLCERLMDAGELPNLWAMRDGGGYRPLGTSIPPQSPVAWASFITGANPGVHGIFDFIHRDPSRQFAPYYSAAETVSSNDGWDVGQYKVPLTFWPFNHAPTQTLLRREGTPFWDQLDAAGVPTWIYEIPANYPPSRSAHGHMHCLSGMGVPDLLGSYGTYQFFSEESFLPKSEEGGMRQAVFFENDRAEGTLTGPQNPYQKTKPGSLPPTARIPFMIYRHPTDASVRIDLQDQTILLRQGEWSDWTKVSFAIGMPPFLPAGTANGICRFYLQEVRPNFRLYVTPVNIDPSDPGDQTITEPPDFIARISDELGLFYTTGFQEDHKARSNRVFTDAEYQSQTAYVTDERVNLLQYAMRHYRDGFLFFYFSGTDLQAHVFWWDADEKHPVRSPEQAKKYNEVIKELYRQMDAIVGEVVRAYGQRATILVMSDHGFANFRRQFNLNTWLRNQGYLGPSHCRSLRDAQRGARVDWTRTRAYGLGLNGLYLNLQGRERLGIVSPGERDGLLEEISRRLLEYRDPADGRPVIARVYRREEVYSGPQVAMAPDLIIGYARDYRASWATTMGDITDEVVSDNDSAWSADHCIAADLVPGVIFSNRPIRKENPSLVDLAPTILELFDIAVPPHLEGSSVFRAGATAAAETGTQR